MINNTWKQWRNGDKWWEKSINMMKTIMKQLQADENWWDKWWNIKTIRYNRWHNDENWWNKWWETKNKHVHNNGEIINMGEKNNEAC